MMIWTGILAAFPALVAALPQFGGGSGLAMLRFGCSQYVSPNSLFLNWTFAYDQKGCLTFTHLYHTK
jgi:hypothetical protein